MKDKFKNLEPVTTTQFLSNSKLACFANTSKNLRTLFQPKLDVRQLLHHVVRGDHNAVCELLENNIDLLSKKGRVTDCSGRTFESISAFEYALWALDRRMWSLMLKCIPPNEQGKRVLAQLHIQYDALCTKENIEETSQIQGITYRLNKEVFTELHFNFQNIIKALQAYLDSVYANKKNDMIKIWITRVGGAQKLLPMYVVSEYCSNTSFTPTPEFISSPVTSTQFYYVGEPRNWFAPDSKLGVYFAIHKGTLSEWIMGDEEYTPWGLDFKMKQRKKPGACAEAYAGPGDVVVADLAAIKTLCEVRTKEFINLANELIKLDTQFNEPMEIDNQPVEDIDLLTWN